VTIPQTLRYRLLFLHRMALRQFMIYRASVFPERFAFSGDWYSPILLHMFLEQYVPNSWHCA